MFLKKVKEKGAAVSLVVVLIMSVIMVPAVGYAANKVSGGMMDRGDDLRTSMPYQVLGPDYVKPEIINDGYTEQEANAYVVQKPTLNGAAFVNLTVPYKTELILNVNPNVFTAPAGTNLSIQAKYSKSADMSNSQTLKVVPGMSNEIYADTPGTYYVQFSATASMNFKVNGSVITKYSDATVQKITISVPADTNFTAYGTYVAPSRIGPTSMIQLRAIMSEGIKSFIAVQVSSNGGATYQTIQDSGKYATGDTAIAFVGADKVNHLVFGSYSDLIMRVVLLSNTDKTSYVTIPIRVYSN